MILIAPDKYRGTMSSIEATRIIADNIHSPSISLPMADGGEGTAHCIANAVGWEYVAKGCYFNPITRQMALDSSSIIGYGCFPDSMSPLDRSSAALGFSLNDIVSRFNPREIYLGVGGTATCDAGRGMLDALNPNIPWNSLIIGLIDVQAPLLPTYAGQLSALSFCPQKGFSVSDIEIIKENFARVIKRYGAPKSLFDGAGGGIGYALASVIGARCFLGAQWMLDRAVIPWNDITMIITGEGCYDRLSALGKAVYTLGRTAASHNIPCVCIAGKVDKYATSEFGMRLVDTSLYMPDCPLSPAVARQRLALATRGLAV